MLHNDRLTLALLLCKIHLKGVHNEPNLDAEFQFFLRGKEGMLNAKPPNVEGLTQEQLEAMSRLSTKLPAFRNLEQKIREMPEFGAWIQQATPEQCVPQLWDEKKHLSPIGIAMHQLLVIQVRIYLILSRFRYNMIVHF